jgi:Holliday junction resolvase RusA-like endonuclease
MSLFTHPQGLVLVTHFCIPRVRTWGTVHDQEYKTQVRNLANLPADIQTHYAWIVFSIRCVVARSRGRFPRQVPDVENIPKLIVDAFTGLLYPDDNIHFVRAVQVEAQFGPDDQEQSEIWIFGMPKEHKDG